MLWLEVMHNITTVIRIRIGWHVAMAITGTVSALL
jgi:hypothetical protein